MAILCNHNERGVKCDKGHAKTHQETPTYAVASCKGCRIYRKYYRNRKGFIACEELVRSSAEHRVDSQATVYANVFTKPIAKPEGSIDLPTIFLMENPPQKRQSDGGPASALSQIPGQLQNLGQLQQGFSSLMNTMKDGKMVMGGFSFVIVPAPDMQQLQGLPTLAGLPSIPSLPGSGTS